MTQNYLALGSAVLLVIFSIVSYVFGRRGAFDTGFDTGWKKCENFMVKEIIKKDGPEMKGLYGE